MLFYRVFIIGKVLFWFLVIVLRFIVKGGLVFSGSVGCGWLGGFF